MKIITLSDGVQVITGMSRRGNLTQRENWRRARRHVPERPGRPFTVIDQSRIADFCATGAHALVGRPSLTTNLQLSPLACRADPPASPGSTTTPSPRQFRGDGGVRRRGRSPGLILLAVIPVLLLIQVVSLLLGGDLGPLPVEMVVVAVLEVLLNLRGGEARDQLLVQRVALLVALPLAVMLPHPHRLEP